MSSIFISYRREDSAGHAGRLYDWLVRRFRTRVFFDVNTIPAGASFIHAIDSGLQQSVVVLAIIGRHWLARDAHNRLLLSNQDDYVRKELVAALARASSGVTVIPVLVHNADMPRRNQLPDKLKPLVELNAVRLHDVSWKESVESLIQQLVSIVGRPGAARGAGPMPTHLDPPDPSRAIPTG